MTPVCWMQDTLLSNLIRLLVPTKATAYRIVESVSLKPWKHTDKPKTPRQDWPPVIIQPLLHRRHFFCVVLIKQTAYIFDSLQKYKLVACSDEEFNEHGLYSIEDLQKVHCCSEANVRAVKPQDNHHDCGFYTLCFTVMAAKLGAEFITGAPAIDVNIPALRTLVRELLSSIHGDRAG